MLLCDGIDLPRLSVEEQVLMRSMAPGDVEPVGSPDCLRRGCGNLVSRGSLLYCGACAGFDTCMHTRMQIHAYRYIDIHSALLIIIRVN